MKFLQKSTVALVSLVSIAATLTPAQAATVLPDVTVTPVTKQKDYNSIAMYNPVTKVARFYTSTQLYPQTLPNMSWVTGESEYKTFDAPIQQGIYRACANDCAESAPFVVSAQPGHPVAPNLVIVPDFTWQAYNDTGGGSMYQDDKVYADGKRHYVFGIDAAHPYGQHVKSMVNVFRPLSRRASGVFENPIDFLRAHGIPVDVVSQTALHTYNYNLKDYKSIILYGHDEYWTVKEQDQLLNAVRSGVNLLSLSGNTGFRRIKYENGLLSFDKVPEGGRYANSTEMPKNGNNPIIKMLGGVYTYYPLKRKLREILKRSYNQEDYVNLMAQGIPNQLSFEQALNYTDGVKVNIPDSPLMAGVVPDKYGFVGVTSWLQRFETDGVPLNNDGTMTSYYRRILQLQNADILGTTWPGTSYDLNNPPTQRVGTWIAKYYGKGRVIVVGDIGWMYALLGGDPNVVQLTLNFAHAMTSPATPLTSQITWANPVNFLDGTALGQVTMAAHEELQIGARCYNGSVKVTCSVTNEAGVLTLHSNATVTSLRVKTTLGGAPGYKVIYDQNIQTKTFG